MNSETIDLIATDPPFNKGRDFHATPDSASDGARFQDRWSWTPEHQKWLEQIEEEDNPRLAAAIRMAMMAHSEGCGAFLCFLGVRLMAMHRLLKPTGNIFIHCDHSAGHYIKAALDAVFGPKNFRNEIIWCYEGSGRSKRWLSRKHDTIFWYSKSEKYIFNQVRVPFPEHVHKMFNKEDERGRYYIDGKNYKYYLEDGRGANDWWADIPSLNHNAKERTGYPTQKPIALYERIIKAASNPGGLVLDPFAGCATTCAVAERTGRQWVGIDLWDKVFQVIKDRIEDQRAFGELDIQQILLSRDLPIRTDCGEVAAPKLRVPTKAVKRQPTMPRSKMVSLLLEDAGGNICAGCDREMDHPAYLELDHKTPRSDGGSDGIDNRVLLCGPCNRKKSNLLTLSGLRRQNKSDGFLA